MLSEAEVVRLRDQLYTLARIAVTLREQSTKTPADIVLPADVQEAIEERAAVLEFDAGFTPPRGNRRRPSFLRADREADAGERKLVMRAVIYCRVSTKDQVQNLSLPTQRKACREYCERHGYTVAREFIEEGESAKTTARTQLQALLTYCRTNKGKVDVVVIYTCPDYPGTGLTTAIQPRP